MSEPEAAPKSAEKRTRWARIALVLTLLLLYTTLGVARDIVNALRPGGYLTFVTSLSLVGAAFLALGLALRRSQRPLQVTFALAMCALPYMAILPLMRTEEKLHLVEYGVVALLAYASFPFPDRAKRFLVAGVFTLAAGWLDEGIQALLPSRKYDLRDVAFNAEAGALALVSLAAVQFIERRRVSPDN